MTKCRFTLVLVLLLASPAAAEVSDKIPSLYDYGTRGTFISFLIVLASYWRRWAGLLLSPLSLLMIFGALDVVRDPYLGPDAIREQGEWYPVAAYSMVGCILASHAFGWWYGGKRDSEPS